MSAPTLLHLVTHEGVARITLDRPPLNILNIELLEQLNQVLDDLPPPPATRFILFSGGGSKAFSAGADIADHVPEKVERMLSSFHRVFRTLWNSDWVTIAAIHGHCLGGGMELATMCDFAIATTQARFAQPEINLACFPPVAAVILPALIGLRRAQELILTGRSLSADEALQMGLINQVVPPEELSQAVSELLGNLTPLSPSVLGLTRRAVLQASGLDFEKALAGVEALYLQKLMKTHDANEGIQARLQKRQPEFTGQ